MRGSTCRPMFDAELACPHGTGLSTKMASGSGELSGGRGPQIDQCTCWSDMPPALVWGGVSGPVVGSRDLKGAWTQPFLTLSATDSMDFARRLPFRAAKPTVEVETMCLGLLAAMPLDRSKIYAWLLPCPV